MNPKTSPIIQLNGIGKDYQKKPVLSDINLSLHPGEILTLIGPNGAGKTTLVRLALGLEQPSTGNISRKKGLKIGYMPQKCHIDSTLPLTVLRFLQIAEPQAQRCEDALKKVAIPDLSHAPFQSISGGEMQRVLLARALLRSPELLVLDEPAQGVDVIGQESLYQLITELRDELNCAVLMVSHDLHFVMAATDKVVCLNHHICCQGSPEQISDNPSYLELFGTRAALYTHKHDHNHDLHGDVICDHGKQGRADEHLSKSEADHG